MSEHQRRRWALAAAVIWSWASCSQRYSECLQLVFTANNILAPQRLHLCDAFVLFAFPSFARRRLSRHDGLTFHFILVSILQQTVFLLVLCSLLTIIIGHLRPGNIKHALRVLAGPSGARSSFKTLQSSCTVWWIVIKHSLLFLWATINGHASPRRRKLNWVA